MADNLVIFGNIHSNVPSIKATDTNNVVRTYIRPQGTLPISSNGTGIDVTQYATVDVAVSGGGGQNFVITLSKNSNTGDWEPDCTYAELLAAHNAEKIISVRTDEESSAATSVGDYYAMGAWAGVWYEVEEVESDGLNEDFWIVSKYYTFDINGVNSDDPYTYYDTSPADAVSGDLASGKIAYGVNGRIVGTYVPPAGTAGTPIATKGTVSNHSISVTPSVTNTAGMISSGTITGTAVTVTASELVSGTKSITENGTGIDVTNYASVDVAVPSTGSVVVSETTDSHGGTVVTITAAETVNLQSGSATPSTSSQTISPSTGYDGFSEFIVAAMPSGSATTPATTITANPSISVNSSTGLITATSSATQSVTPTVSAGYVASGTAGTITVSGSNTSQLTVQAGTTITPTKSQQTAVASGKFTTGNVLVAAIPAAYQDVTGVTAAAGDVVSGKDIVNSSGTVVHGSLVIQHYYTGSSTPSSSLGDNGDIYLQTS